MPKPYKRKRNVMRKFVISELSAVDVPAQAGARALIMKRGKRPADPETTKSDVVQAVTGEANGHVHGIRIRQYSDGELSIWVMHATAEEGENPHDHMLFRAPDGTYSVLENAGHTHTLDNTALAAAIVNIVQKEDAMTPEEKARLEKAEKANERFEKIVGLSKEHREYFDGLSTDELKDKWLAKSAGERDDALKEAARKAEEEEAKKNAEDPVVHTTKDGIEIRKSDGPTVLAMAKRQDAQAEELASERATNATLRKAAETAAFEKRAETELAHLPGTVEHRALLLKAAEGIEDEEARKAAVAALKAQNAAQASAFTSFGVSAGGETAKTAAGGGDAQAKLDELTKAFQKDHDGMSFEQAQAAVLDTAEGAEIYAQIDRH